MARDYGKIYKKILNEGFFSEYLPPCFSLNEEIFSKIPSQNCDLIKPYSFSMSRFNANNSRRVIYIPEIGAYAVLNKFVKDNNILKELTEFIDKNSVSFSPVIMEDGTIMKHDQVYNDNSSSDEKLDSNYISNIISKLIKSAGAKKVLKLDIANCFSSIYTHFLPTILLGYDLAEENYKKKLRNLSTDPIFNVYSKLDSMIRKQNNNQTNGLLVGPILSKLIVEALLTRIDIELKNKNILFSRYMDDYEIYLFKDDEKNIINTFVSILKKYNLSLNFEKIQIVDFPYYNIENFDKIINLYRGGKVESFDLIKLFNIFLEIEKSGTKGAVRYLLKSLDTTPIVVDNNELLNSYILSIMSNDDRSLTKACSLIIKNFEKTSLNEEYIFRIKDMLKLNIEKEYDLEVIWLLYVLIETKNINQEENLIESLINSNNELAKILLLRKKLVKQEDINKIKERAYSWILNYELYVDNYIDENEFFEKVLINKNKDMYKKMKEKEINFCY